MKRAVAPPAREAGRAQTAAATSRKAAPPKAAPPKPQARPPTHEESMRRLGSFAHYADPLYYTHTYAPRDTDVRYYVEQACAAGGDVLELGAGNGRITLPMARHGVRVVAVDHSRPMLDDLRARLTDEPAAVAARVRVHEGDIRGVRLRRRFARVFCPFNTALHLYTRDDAERFFATVKQHLAPGGELVVDLSVPLAENLARDPEKPYGAPRFKHPTEGVVRYKELFDYDPKSQVLLVTMQFFPEAPRPAFATLLAHRQYYPQEWEALLHYNGFSHLRVFGDFHGGPLTRESDVMVWHARLAAPSSSSSSARRGASVKAGAR